MGGWEASGVDPAHFSHGLCGYMEARARDVRAGTEGQITPGELLEAGYADLVADPSVTAGGSTACVAVGRRNGVLEVAKYVSPCPPLLSPQTLPRGDDMLVAIDARRTTRITVSETRVSCSCGRRRSHTRLHRRPALLTRPSNCRKSHQLCGGASACSAGRTFRIYPATRTARAITCATGTCWSSHRTACGTT